MGPEAPRSELDRLHREQSKARQDEMFGGLSPGEHAEYNERTKRINELEIEVFASTAAANTSKPGTQAEQINQWNKEAEPDTHQDEAHQPYRSREKDPNTSATDSSRNRSMGNNEPDEKGRD